MTKKDGGAVREMYVNGVPLRDWYAGMALMGILANPGRIGGSAEEAAATADHYADAMLQQREK